MKITRKSSLFFLGAASLAVMGLALTSQQPRAAEQLDKDAVKAIIKEYLKEHPEDIMQALTDYQANEEAFAKRLFTENMEKNKDRLQKASLPFIGNPDGDVVIVEFFDYNCGYCKRAVGEVQKLVEADKNIKVIFHEMPILSPTSADAARYALAAHKQGKYFEYHQAVMNKNAASSVASLEKVAEEIGLDVEKLKQDAKSNEVRAAVDDSLNLSRELGIRGTPAFIIGGTLVPGYMTAKDLQNIIEQERDEKDKG